MLIFVILIGKYQYKKIRWDEGNYQNSVNACNPLESQEYQVDLGSSELQARETSLSLIVDFTDHVFIHAFLRSS